MIFPENFLKLLNYSGDDAKVINLRSIFISQLHIGYLDDALSSLSNCDVKVSSLLISELLGKKEEKSSKISFQDICKFYIKLKHMIDNNFAALKIDNNFAALKIELTYNTDIYFYYDKRNDEPYIEKESNRVEKSEECDILFEEIANMLKHYNNILDRHKENKSLEIIESLVCVAKVRFLSQLYYRYFDRKSLSCFTEKSQYYLSLEEISKRLNGITENDDKSKLERYILSTLQKEMQGENFVAKLYQLKDSKLVYEMQDLSINWEQYFEMPGKFSADKDDNSISITPNSFLGLSLFINNSIRLNMFLQQMYSQKVLESNDLYEICYLLGHDAYGVEVRKDSLQKSKGADKDFWNKTSGSSDIDEFYEEAEDYKKYGEFSAKFTQGEMAIELAILSKMDDLQKEYDEKIKDFQINDETSKTEYIKRCVILCYEFIQIHPLKDKNGRTSRALLNVLLMKKRFAPIALYDSYLDRKEYFSALESANKGDFIPMTDLVCSRMKSKEKKDIEPEL